MKNVRIILGVVAIVFAFGAAIASQNLSPIQGYRFIDNPSPQPDQCVYHSDCDDQGGTECTVTINGNSVRLRAQTSSTVCGANLFKLP